MIVLEAKAVFPDVEVGRCPGVINAYRWPAFREALEATGRKKVIIAGVTDSTCLLLPSLDMVLDGYEVHRPQRRRSTPADRPRRHCPNLGPGRGEGPYLV